MAVQIVASDVNAEDFAVEYSPPVRRGLIGVSFMNTSLSKLAHNYAPGGVSGSVVGAPIVTNMDALTSGSAYVQTNLSESDSMTVISVARFPDTGADAATRGCVYGNYSSPSVADPAKISNGLSLWQDAGVKCNACWIDASGNPINIMKTLAVANPEKWAIYVHVVTPTTLDLRDATNGTKSAGTTPLSRLRGSAKFRIGRTTYDNFLGKTNIAAIQFHNVALSEAEISATVENLRTYVARKGIIA
ncbi:hypothetical protein [Pseudomonas fluorescens]|uniref:Uncharacterized protein n=1 Tax=Pseudomonas fluorescens TaxID=294 RepID=A0A5E7CBS0_PSEFL|nr:hypothetical protein [Pseudomonas fluorescens]VVN93303.1 hypothetical protein PS691_02040 [Pseudomonas fluorescens]